MNENIMPNEEKKEAENVILADVPRLDDDATIVASTEVSEAKPQEESLTKKALENGKLPLGSVVLMRDAKKKIMITGYSVTSPASEDKIWDYIGCIWPEGIISLDKNLLFDHKDIQQVFYVGYVDDEQRRFMDFLDNFNKNQIANQNSDNVK